MGDAVLAIVIAECSGAVESAEGDVFEKVVAAMRAAQHSMAYDDDTRIRGAIGAVMKHYGEDSPEYKALTKELQAIRTLSAMMSGVPVDLSQLDIADGERAMIGLVPLWKAITKGEDVEKLRPKPTPEEHAERGPAKCPFCDEDGEGLVYEHKDNQVRMTCSCGAAGSWEDSIGLAAQSWNDVADAVAKVK